jgi:hypothetical protein
MFVAATICLALIGCVVLALAGVTTPASVSRELQCRNNGKRIGLAILNYESVNGHLPPAYSRDESGNPLHSWRVLILPFLDEEVLYNAIDLTKPWYHPDNLALADQMPDWYRCPSYETPGNDVTTPYIAFVGNQTVWPRDEYVKLSLRYPRSKTALVVESERYRLHWMSTGDPGIESLGPPGNKLQTSPVATMHDHGLCVLCDGAIEGIEAGVDHESLRELLTIEKE